MFGNAVVGVQEWNNRVCWVIMRGDCALGDAFRAGRYFWELIEKVHEKYECDDAQKWVIDQSGRFKRGYNVDSEFLTNTGKNRIKVTIQNDENDVFGPYTQVIFMLKENEG
jgi:hypothetical protein